MMHDPQTDRFIPDRDYWRHDLGNTLTVIAARTRLQHRLTARSSSLTEQERTQSLTNLDAVLAALAALEIQLEALLHTGPVPPADPS